MSPLIGSGTAANRKSVEHQPEMTNNSRRDPAPNNRKRKEKTKAVGVKAMTETKLEDGNSKQEINSSPQTILTVPQYTHTSCTETAAGSDVTDLDESLPVAETKR